MVGLTLVAITSLTTVAGMFILVPLFYENPYQTSFSDRPVLALANETEDPFIADYLSTGTSNVTYSYDWNVSSDVIIVVTERWIEAVGAEQAIESLEFLISQRNPVIMLPTSELMSDCYHEAARGLGIIIPSGIPDMIVFLVYLDENDISKLVKPNYDNMRDCLLCAYDWADDFV